VSILYIAINRVLLGLFNNGIRFCYKEETMPNGKTQVTGGVDLSLPHLG
jgi:hypothetical protein